MAKSKIKVIREITALKFKEIDVTVPDYSGTNIEYWFKPITMKELTIIREDIRLIEEDYVRKFFEVPF